MKFVVEFTVGTSSLNGPFFEVSRTADNRFCVYLKHSRDHVRLFFDEAFGVIVWFKNAFPDCTQEDRTALKHMLESMVDG